jgi:hypothetical protein
MISLSKVKKLCIRSKVRARGNDATPRALEKVVNINRIDQCWSVVAGMGQWWSEVGAGVEQGR